jgi:ABC-type amino acid transport substrate-binding protein/anti-sigma regulatory factor (Ser/Thr protein kinase)
MRYRTTAEERIANRMGTGQSLFSEKFLSTGITGFTAHVLQLRVPVLQKLPELLNTLRVQVPLSIRMETIPSHNRFLSRGMRTALLAVIALLLILAIIQPAAGAREIRVALHELPPSLYTDEKGEPAGIFVDLIQDIAAREGWHIIWVRGTMQESWDRLGSGQVDLVMGVTSTPERETLFDFTREPAVSSWAQVYTRRGAGINSILDLDGKRVVLVKGNINSLAFRDYAQKFGISPVYSDADTLEEAFNRTAQGTADATVALRIAGKEGMKKYGLTESTVMFNPSSFGFAVLEGKNADLLQAIDRYLAEGKNNPSSSYSQIMQRWFGDQAGWVIPPWLIVSLIISLGLIALFVIMSVVLRREVQKKTAELSRQNRELQSEVANRMRAEDELVRKNEEIGAAYEELTATAEELKYNYDELHRSQKALEQARNKLSLLNTITFQDIQNAVFSLSGYFQLETGNTNEQQLQRYREKELGIVQTISDSLKFANYYQNLGLLPPAWQNVQQTFMVGISRMDLTGISRNIDVKNLEIFADPMLEQVFFTLAENVTLHGKNATEISLHYRKTGHEVILVFKDNGAGIPDTVKQDIFSRMYEKRKGKGLFLAREILEITGITIQETGEPGNGARFEMTVPEGAWRFAGETQ